VLVPIAGNLGILQRQACPHLIQFTVSPSFVSFFLFFFLYDLLVIFEKECREKTKKRIGYLIFTSGFFGTDIHVG